MILNLHWNESNKFLFDNAITYKLIIKYKLVVIDEQCQKSNETIRVNRREYYTRLLRKLLPIKKDDNFKVRLIIRQIVEILYYLCNTPTLFIRR